ncbi:MAG: DUF1571 domain-containing protein, partial [Planctomycetaceae bacterium]
MTRAFHRRPLAARRRNFSAMLVSLAAIATLILQFQPEPAGADPDALHVRTDGLGLLLDPPVLASHSNSGAAQEPSSAASAGALDNRQALLFSILLLEKGHDHLRAHGNYTATVFTRERVKGVLLDPQVMMLKMRHEPLSLYLKWLVGDKGRELLYVDGQNDGNMIVKVGGIKGKLLPALKLAPTGDLALKEARHPVTEIGLLELARQLIQKRKQDLDSDGGFHCVVLADREVGGRPCYGFIQSFDSRTHSPGYRKCVLLIDKEQCLPV